MTKLCQVRINDETFAAHQGDLLLDAALMNGIEVPHDCRSGYCGTCKVRVLGGHTFGGASPDGLVHACQARVISDLRVAIEDRPPAAEVQGRVETLTQIAPDVFEVCIAPQQTFGYLPGQYVSVQFRGYPARHYSPTAPLDAREPRDVLRFHVRTFARGRVSSALGRGIRPGHRAKLTGPHGAAYFRPRNASRFVLVASGTGFAPIWSVADAAMREWPERELSLIAGGRTLQSLYMIPALCQLAHGPRVTITLTASQRQNFTRAVRLGRPTDWLPPLRADDLVYAAGAPAMVDAVIEAARAAGATCFADPFAPADAWQEPTLLERAAGWFAPRARAEARITP